ncbi:MAG: aromatic amino acid lyase, partial [Leptospira sp.]|nr:aromatic amino acid lyase [Leptospira sp.]
MDSKLIFAIANNQEKFPESEIVHEQVLESHSALLQYIVSISPNEAWLYGVDTNFGPHAYLGLPDRVAIQRSLVNHLSVTKNKPEYFLNHHEARAVLTARIRVLGLGRSGVRMDLIERLIQLLDEDDIPNIPIHGSLGASGDLIPLSAIAKHL